ncbi:MAG: hypothetical protein UT08_C0027G0002 [Candidatus Woesebacteria bacterium GW2011_GWB1_38_8]|uniref:Uncharacterized protein n=1 Tax=Candidatus Woesebacteria bacterium GW2011_GWB1_38_8 TaxID=1618570 RepID=A0A0G0L7T2_9BACT|nr:MAG: hypothetical protein UT08_C0027G0002 [Candidatus Woesebacteria bacterium GW2011_GWB1_38_8]
MKIPNRITKHVVLLILLLLVVFLLSKLPKKETNQASQTENPVITQENLFVVKSGNSDKKHKAYLFNTKSNTLQEKEIDLSQTGWDISLLNDRYHTYHGTEAVHYNPNTGDIVVIVGVTSGGIGGWKSQYSLPEPSYKYAIYKTSFSEDEPLSLVTEYNEEKPFLKFIELSVKTNSLYVFFYSGNGANIKFDHISVVHLDSGLVEKKTLSNMPDFGMGNVSDINLSQDEDEIYQFGVDGYNLSLLIFDLNENYLTQKDIYSGDNNSRYEFDINGLSFDGKQATYYVLQNPKQPHGYVINTPAEKKLLISDIEKGSVVEIPLDGEVGNYNLYINSVGNKILYGLKNGWYSYDSHERKSENVPFDRPILWSPQSNSVHISNGEIIIEINGKTVNTGIEVDSTNDLQVVQWR